jgi:sporulation protein YlmC with PRC-barrel domain
VELNPEPWAFSDLVGSRVSDRSGHSLGRVFEVRAHWQGDGSILIDELIVGRSGLRLRLRGPGAAGRGIPWAAVASVKPGQIVING